MLNELKDKGELIRFGIAAVFFGNRRFTPVDYKELKTAFCELKQVHGDKVLPAQTTKQVGDGQFTTDKNTALVIRTADCMPVFMTDKTCRLIMGLHIGWRGLDQKILSGGVDIFKEKYNLMANELYCWVGPHIHQKSYCLPDQAVKGLLHNHHIPFATAIDQEIIKPSHQRFNQWNINLSSILRKEAHGLGIKNFHDYTIDTFTSIDHYSHRRYGFRQGLNYSFILKS